MSTPISLSTSMIQPTEEQTLALIQELGDEKLFEIVTSQLKALSVTGESEVLRQQRLLLVQKVVNTAIIIRQHRTLQSEMAELALLSKQAVSEARARVVEDQTLLHQEQVAHDQTVGGTLAGIDRTNQATQEIVQSRIQMQEQDIARTKKNLNKAEQDILDKKEREQALLAQSRSLSAALGNN